MKKILNCICLVIIIYSLPSCSTPNRKEENKAIDDIEIPSEIQYWDESLTLARNWNKKAELSHISISPKIPGSRISRSSEISYFFISNKESAPVFVVTCVNGNCNSRELNLQLENSIIFDDVSINSTEAYDIALKNRGAFSDITEYSGIDLILKRKTIKHSVHLVWCIYFSNYFPGKLPEESLICIDAENGSVLRIDN